MTHINTVSYKIALVTLVDAQTVLLKRGKAAVTIMSHLDQAAVHLQRPKHFTYIQGFTKG